MNYREFLGEIKTVVAPVLGVYRRQDGSTLPAILGLFDQGVRPPELRPEGLEVIVRRTAEPAPRSLLCDGFNHSQRWRFYLLQWPGVEGKNGLENAQYLLGQRWGSDLRGAIVGKEQNALADFTVLAQWAGTVTDNDAVFTAGHKFS